MLTVLAAVLRFVGIGHQGFWFDEGNTALLVHFSPGKMLGLIPQSESTPPLYYCLAWLWARVLRLHRGAAALALGPGRRAHRPGHVRRRRAGCSAPASAVVTAALVASNPLLIWYSQEARSYALLVLLSAVTLWAFAARPGAPDAARRSRAWVIACALALATHYYALLAVVPEARVAARRASPATRGGDRASVASRPVRARRCCRWP